LLWHFNEDIFKNFDWTTEPSESIEELYRRRAQSIRDRYDYIVIWYSGGPDSWNMVNTFLKNNIKIDEIAHCMSYEGDGDKRSFFNEEIFYTAIPKTQAIVEQHPHIKHRVVDLSPIIVDVFSKPDIADEFIYSVKALATPNSFARSYLRDYVDEYKQLIDSGKRVCFLWGSEKPRVSSINGQYHCVFLDYPSETQTRLQDQDYLGCFDEWFYWSPETAPLVAKQCHMILKFYQNETMDSQFMTDVPLNYVPPSKKTGRYLKKDVFHTLLYPGWDPTTLVQPKPKNMLISERDDWFIHSSKETHKSVFNVQGGIVELVREFGSTWLNDPLDPSKGINGCRNSYPLEKSNQNLLLTNFTNYNL
jgi:hypothetical protein